MPTLKEALCLLAIVIAYGAAGRMDYDDALLFDEVQRAPNETLLVCATDAGIATSTAGVPQRPPRSGNKPEPCPAPID